MFYFGIFLILHFQSDRISYITPIHWLTLLVMHRTFIPPWCSKLNRSTQQGVQLSYFPLHFSVCQNVIYQFRQVSLSANWSVDDLVVGELVCRRVVRKVSSCRVILKSARTAHSASHHCPPPACTSKWAASTSSAHTRIGGWQDQMSYRNVRFTAARTWKWALSPRSICWVNSSCNVAFHRIC